MPGRRRLPPLNSVRAFEAAARHPSFQAAAEELAVTAGAVAQHVKALEQWLGVSLFRRLPSKGVALTPAGARYARTVQELLDRLDEATRRLRDQDRADVLTVATVPSFASQWLIPRLGAFRAAHSAFDVRVVASNTLTDFAREDVDVAVRWGRGAYPGLWSELLLAETFFPVCAAALVDGGEHPLRTVGDLRFHTLLHEEEDWQIPGSVDWARWLVAAGAPRFDTRRGPRFTHTFLALQAAAAGQGVALATSVLIGEDLATRRLVKPFGPDVPGAYDYYLVSPPACLELAKVTSFIAWIRAAVADAKAAGEGAARAER